MNKEWWVINETFQNKVSFMFKNYFEIALLAVSFQAIKATIATPVKSLRME
ncbi:MAG: hypothetical protein ABI358_09130 [Ginsengibacter sp.]